MPDVSEWGGTNTNFKAVATAIAGLAGRITSLNDKVFELQAAINNSIKALEGKIPNPAVPVLSEESEVLWWLFNERSVDLGQKFSEIPDPTAALVIAKELADRTHLLPAPPAADSFLRKGLGDRGDKTIPMPTLIESTPVKWRSDFMPCPSRQMAHLDALSPLLCAITTYCELDGNWQASFEKATALSAKSQLAAASWARQLYDELLLLRAVRHAQA